MLQHPFDRRPLAFALAGLGIGLGLFSGSCTPNKDQSIRQEVEFRDPSLRQKVLVAPPLELEGSAFEAAAMRTLEPRAPVSLGNLENFYRLSDHVFSGGEPESEQAFGQLAQMGVRTILSVDGAAPDAETAEKYGLRYVHVPLQYRGFSSAEIMELTKTFRELPGPFYVHCFHGRHRGPAAAALGRLVLDGVEREEALAEMRQWCGTSEKYEGLYQVIAGGEIPGAEETAAYDWDFPSLYKVSGFRQGMADLTRSYDLLEILVQQDWLPSEAHPDVDARNEARKTAEILQQCHELVDFKVYPEGFQHLMEQSVKEAENLEKALQALYEESSIGADARKAASAKALNVFERLDQTCLTCHKQYRNQ